MYLDINEILNIQWTDGGDVLLPEVPEKLLEHSCRDDVIIHP
jgi:hypothetical protein